MFGRALADIDQKVYRGELVPRHGPGATADKRRGNKKWIMPYWYDRLEYLFPYRDYALPNLRYAREEQDVNWMSPWNELPVLLTPVPKTYTTPRLIAIEPTVMQYIQQAIMTSLVPALENDPLAGLFVAFTDQSRNQELAQWGSYSGALATLDLSEASDRVANWLVEDLFADFPWFLEGIQACRSTTIQLPSGEKHNLQKFASMGSALTFPIESMIFTVIALLGCLGASTDPSDGAIRHLAGSVRVYGDDIVVPTDKAEVVIDLLETFGFRVNRGKSFWTGPFRESCGKEYFAGSDVTIVRCRESFPRSRHSVKQLVSLSSFRNQLCEAGWLSTVEILDKELTKLLNGYYPFISKNTACLGRIGPEPPEVQRLNLLLFRYEVRGYVVNSRLPSSILNEAPALLKCLSHPEISRYDPTHLTRSGRPRVVSLKLAWVHVA